MFNSAILDVAAGVIFGFLAVSLFTSAAVESVNSLFKLRSRGLLSGIKQLVNDPDFTGLAKALYQHAAVSPRGPGGNAPLARFPAYVDPKQFAGALLDITGLSGVSASAAGQAPGPAAVEALKAQLANVTDPQLKQLLEGIVNRTGGEAERLEAEVAAWFDTGMDRVGGAFKRWTQLATFAIALIIAFVVNVDSVRVATLLWEHPALADKLTSSSTLPSAVMGEPKTEEDAATELTTMMEASLPVGWAPGHFMEASDGHGGWRSIWSFPTFLWSLFGWLVTGVAALFGAPFWFDTLQMVTRLKGTGPSPAEKMTGRSAAS